MPKFAFPDYDNQDQYDALFAALEAAGHKVEHGSWKNDSCPKVIVNDIFDVFVDYKDQALRESKADPAFTFFIWQWETEQVEVVRLSTVEQVVEWFAAEEGTERLDVEARALMDTKPDLPKRSLDEWLLEFGDKLADDERRMAAAILARY